MLNSVSKEIMDSKESLLSNSGVIDGKDRKSNSIITYEYTLDQQMMIGPEGHIHKLPKDLQPNDFLTVTALIAIFCGVFNIGSLLWSIPALLCSLAAYSHNERGCYAKAQKLGYYALALDIVCVAWLLVSGIITLGIIAATQSDLTTVALIKR